VPTCVGPAIEVAVGANVGEDVGKMARKSVGATIGPVGLAVHASLDNVKEHQLRHCWKECKSSSSLVTNVAIMKGG